MRHGSENSSKQQLAVLSCFRALRARARGHYIHTIMHSLTPHRVLCMLHAVLSAFCCCMRGAAASKASPRRGPRFFANWASARSYRAQYSAPPHPPDAAPHSTPRVVWRGRSRPDRQLQAAVHQDYSRLGHPYRQAQQPTLLPRVPPFLLCYPLTSCDCAGCTKWCTAGGYHTPGYSCTVSGHCQVDNSCGTGSYCRYPYNPNGQNSMYACAPAFCAAHSDGRTCTQTLNRGPAGTTAQVACTGAQHATQGACAQQLTAVQQQHLIGAFVPQCDAAGHFEPLQCHGSTGACWCVDTATGVEVPNTRGQATVASCQATAPPGCTTYFDGCNTCTRPDVTSAMTCTMMYCMQPGPAVCRGWAAGWDEAEGGH